MSIAVAHTAAPQKYYIGGEIESLGKDLICSIFAENVLLSSLLVAVTNIGYYNQCDLENVPFSWHEMF